jgi:hypothetical protein
MVTFSTKTLHCSFRWLPATYGVQRSIPFDVSTFREKSNEVRYYHSGVFRPLRESDLAAIHSINALNVPAVGEESPESLRSIMAMADVALGVVDEQSLVGFVFVLPPGTTYDSPNYRYFCERYDDFVYVDRVAFLPSHQGIGLGAALYQEVERRVSPRMITLEVNVVPPNAGSMRFHLREGFSEVDQLETRPGKIVSLMVKSLSPTSPDMVSR